MICTCRSLEKYWTHTCCERLMSHTCQLLFCSAMKPSIPEHRMVEIVVSWTLRPSFPFKVGNLGCLSSWSSLQFITSPPFCPSNTHTCICIYICTHPALERSLPPSSEILVDLANSFSTRLLHTLMLGDRSFAGPLQDKASIHLTGNVYVPGFLCVFFLLFSQASPLSTTTALMRVAVLAPLISSPCTSFDPTMSTSLLVESYFHPTMCLLLEHLLSPEVCMPSLLHPLFGAVSDRRSTTAHHGDHLLWQ